MTTSSVGVFQVPYRNFNVCPHCTVTGQQAVLGRLCEGLPMISRSDGETFHLLLADRPLPYPSEHAAGPTRKLSLCFWYTHVRQPKQTFTTIVVLAGSRAKHSTLFRKIELVADLLTAELTIHGKLAEVYELFEDPAGASAVS